MNGRPPRIFLCLLFSWLFVAAVLGTLAAPLASTAEAHQASLPQLSSAMSLADRSDRKATEQQVSPDEVPDLWVEETRAFFRQVR